MTDLLSTNGASEPASDTYLPLAGVRVLDLSRLIVGGLATRQLADLGAEVVKVEPPVAGDYLREIPPMLHGKSIWHELLNRNKRSIALDIVGNPDDLRTLHRLIAVADVVVDVSRPGGLGRLGIDVAALRLEHPHLIVCSISGYGQTGEWAQLPAHGLNMDSLAGVTATVAADGIDRFLQVQYTGNGQEGGGMNAALSVCAALVGVQRTGQGVWIDISCWDAAVEANRTAIAYQAATGNDVRVDYAHMWGSMHGIYRTKDDRPFFIAVIEKKFWQRFCAAVERPELVPLWHGDGDVDYGDLEARPVIAELMASRTSAEWSSFFQEHNLPGTPLLTLSDVMGSEHFKERGLLETGSDIPNVAGPIRWLDRGGSRPGAHPTPPPLVGADTDEVLAAWLGTS